MSSSGSGAEGGGGSTSSSAAGSPLLDDEEKRLVEQIQQLTETWKYVRSGTADALVQRTQFFLSRSDRVEALVDVVARDENMILVHGVTGVGKSALALRLKTADSGQDFVDMLREISDGTQVVTKITDDNQPLEIGDGTNGTTIVPNRIVVDGTVLLDMPGLQDQSAEHVFSIQVVHRLLMRDMHKVQIACIVPVSVFTEPTSLLHWMETWRDAEVHGRQQPRQLPGRHV
jgi:putative ribosome biogenesis GTPase RsgA